jgi:hypothetical protein
MFEDSVMIVAHPDDDILWLGSVLDKVENIIFCFNDIPRNPAIGSARKKVIAEYPLRNVVSLGITEPLSFNQADWSQPVTTEYGIELVKSKVLDAAYRESYEKLVDLVRGSVAVWQRRSCACIPGSEKPAGGISLSAMVFKLLQYPVINAYEQLYLRLQLALRVPSRESEARGGTGGDLQTSRLLDLV